MNRRNTRGQTTIEWLLLTAMCFIVGYFMITRPIGDGAREVLQTLVTSLGSIVRHGQIGATSTTPAGVSDARHPGSAPHSRALHL